MFSGMRGTGDWVANQRPENWRQQILYLYPNGSAPLTAILSMMGSESVDDPRFHWWTQEQSAVGGAVSHIYTLPDLSKAYVSGGVAGDVVYAQITTTLANRIREGHQILLRDASDYSVDVVGKVIGVTRGTTDSVLAVKLLEMMIILVLTIYLTVTPSRSLVILTLKAVKCLMLSPSILRKSIITHRSSVRLCQ